MEDLPPLYLVIDNRFGTVKIDVRDLIDDYFIVFVNGTPLRNMKDLTDRDADSSFSEEEFNVSELCFSDGHGHVAVNGIIIFDKNVRNFSCNRLRKELLQKRTDFGYIFAIELKNLYASNHTANAILENLCEQQDSEDCRIEKFVLQNPEGMDFLGLSTFGSMLMKGAPMRVFDVSGIKNLSEQIKKNFTDLFVRLAKSGMQLGKLRLSYFSESAEHGLAILVSLASNEVNTENLMELDLGRNDQWFKDILLARKNTIALCNVLKQSIHLQHLNVSYNGLDGAQLEMMFSSLRETFSV